MFILEVAHSEQFIGKLVYEEILLEPVYSAHRYIMARRFCFVMCQPPRGKQEARVRHFVPTFGDLSRQVRRILQKLVDRLLHAKPSGEARTILCAMIGKIAGKVGLFPGEMGSINQPIQSKIGSMLNWIRSLGLCLAVWVAAPSAAIPQANDYNVIEVCNKGNVLLEYAVFATKTDYWMGDRAEASAWYKIRPGKCQNVNPGTYRGVSVGFRQQGHDGVWGNPVYSVRNVDRRLDGRFETDVMCLPAAARIEEIGSLESIRRKIRPPCGEGHHEFKMSFYVQPNDVFSKITLRPDKYDTLPLWPSEPAVSKQQRLRNRSVSILDASCREHYSLFDEDGLQALCTCPSREIVENHQDVVYLIEFSISNGDGFNEAIKVVNLNDLKQYAYSCLADSDP